MVKKYDAVEELIRRAERLTEEEQKRLRESLFLGNIDKNKDLKEQGKIVHFMDGSSFEEVEEQVKKGDKVEGFSTGYWTLDRMTAGLVPGELTVISAESGLGKCFKKGTLVLMANGETRPIEKIKAGDLVQGVNGIRKVLGSHSGFGECYKIIPRKGEPFYVSDHHIMSCYVKGKIENLFIEDLLKKGTAPNGDIRSYNLYRAKVDYPRKELSIPPYILGVWLGDGSKNSVAITTKDSIIRNTWCAYGEEQGCFVKEYTRWNEKLGRNSLATTFYLRVNKGHKNPILEKLRAIGVLGDKNIPLQYLTGDKSQRLELLAGLLDTDGYYGGKCYEICSCNENLAQQILQLARGLGFGAYSNPKVVNGKTYARITISGDLDEIPCRLKKALPRKQIKNVLHTGFRIERVEDDYYYGIAVDGDELFLLADYTVVHNTNLCVNMIARQMVLGYKILFITLENTVKSVRRRLRLIMGPEYFPELAKEDTLYVQEHPTISQEAIRFAVQSAKEKGIQIVYIDHLQYLDLDSDNIAEATGAVVRNCKTLSQEFDIPIVLVSQMRKIQKGEECGVDDLYGSVKIRQTADVILIGSQDNKELFPHLVVRVHKQRERVLWRRYSSIMLKQFGFNLEEPSYNESVDAENDVTGKPRGKGSQALSFR